MDQEAFGREMLRLYYEGGCEVTAMERVELILPCPEIISGWSEVHRSLRCRGRRRIL